MVVVEPEERLVGELLRISRCELYFQEGISYLQRTVKGQFRMSAARAFLKPARKRSNLRIISSAHVTRILLNNKRVVGVNFKIGSKGANEQQLSAVSLSFSSDIFHNTVTVPKEFMGRPSR